MPLRLQPVLCVVRIEIKVSCRRYGSYRKTEHTEYPAQPQPQKNAKQSDHGVKLYVAADDLGFGRGTNYGDYEIKDKQSESPAWIPGKYADKSPRY